MRHLLLLILTFAAPLFAAIEFSDPTGMQKRMGCRWSVFKFALEPVVERLVEGRGKIIIIPAFLTSASVPPDSMLADLRFLFSDLRILSTRIQNDALSRAVHNVDKLWPEDRLAFCLLTDGCFLNNSRGSVYVPLRLSDQEDEQTSPLESGTKKKRAIKTTPKRRPTMKATPKAKREPQDDEGDEKPETKSALQFNMPHVILMKIPDEDDRVTEVSIMGAFSSSLVLYSEWVRIEEWKARNLKRKAESQSPLFLRFQENPKLAAIFKTMRSQSALSAIYQSQRPTGWKEIEKLIVIEAVNNGVYLAKELSDLYPNEKISKKNVFAYVDMISADLDQ